MSAFTATSVAAQSDIDIKKLDPDLIALYGCNGSVSANALVSHDNGFLSEDRARTTIKVAMVGSALSAVDRQGIDHLVQYEDAYQEFADRAFTQTIVLLNNDQYDWEDQIEIDNCTARLTAPLLESPVQILESGGVSDGAEIFEYFKAQADENFAFTLKVIEAAR